VGFVPPKGVKPPQLEGKRTGRPNGSRNHAGVWSNVLWAFENRNNDDAIPPTKEAGLWWGFARSYPYQFRTWLKSCGRI
jgi:hypothetical protein